MDYALWTLLCMAASVGHALGRSHIQCDGQHIINTVGHCSICTACFLILTYPVWWVVLWALLYMAASVERAFQYLHTQCDGFCIMNTVVYGCICGACFPILTYPVSWMSHFEHCCVWLHLWSMLSNIRISSVLNGWRIMNTVVYGCIFGACFPILAYPVWWLVYYEHCCIWLHL